MNMKTVLVKVTDEQTNSSGFCLQQAMLWIQKLYDLGAIEMAAADEVAAENVKRAISSGHARIVARFDLTQQSCSFNFCTDSAGENAQEQQLFTHFFEPSASRRTLN